MRICLVVLVTCSLWVEVSAATLQVELSFDRRAAACAWAWVDGAEAGDPSTAVVVDQKDKTFVPAIVAAPPGGKVLFKNSDAIKHNVNAKHPETGKMIDGGMIEPTKDVTIPVDWPAGEFVRFGCNIHPKMQVYVGSIPSKVGAPVAIDKASKTGKATIAGAPDDAKVLKVWVSKHDVVSVTLTDGAGTADITRKGKAVGKVTVKKE